MKVRSDKIKAYRMSQSIEELRRKSFKSARVKQKIWTIEQIEVVEKQVEVWKNTIIWHNLPKAT